MAYITNTLTIIITLVFCAKQTIPNGYDYSYNPFITEYTRNISLKQGVLQGFVVEPQIGRDQRYRVGVFRGIPYAAPPVGGLRFMPTVGAPSWFGVKYADKFAPVCPQKFPDEKKMPPYKREQFLRLKEYLVNQSEDCLYLNIYTPLSDDVFNTRKYPVMVFISGESFEWNSGNPYDGSVLAAYGNVIVVTINFRLGILGFLKAGTEEMSKSNFGLVDQIASLVWIKDNIAAFGGDSNSVTLFGHGTGAVCASLLMISPMVLKGNDRLFHRAILMGGTALADWALAGNPGEVTYQVAKALNCQIHDDFAECLRRKRLDEIMAAGAITPDYKTRFGPVVDSLVVPNDPKKSMTQYNDIFRRFELMYGVTEMESINLLDPLTFSQGMLLKERDKELRTYFRTRCEMKPELCLQRTLDEYSHGDILQNNVQKKDGVYDYSGYEPDQASLARDTLLDILSDARSVAPMVQMAKYHAAVNMQSYFYVFKHKTESRDYIREKSYSGEELPYVFGVPLGGPKFHFVDSYKEQERLFSEIVMMYFSNFAETGNPNVPRRERYNTMSPAYWPQFDVEWPEFDLKEERYLELDIPPQPGQHYRASKVKYWNEIFPTITENFTFGAAHPTKSPIHRTPPPWLYNNLPNTPTANPKNIYENFRKPLKHSPSVFGTVVTSGNRPDNIEENIYGKVIESFPEEVKQSSTMNIVAVAGGLFLLANVVLLIIVYYKCKKKRKNLTTPPAAEDKKFRADTDDYMLNGCNIVRMINKSSVNDDTYEAVSPDTSPKYKLTRQMSGSTIDAHTKVREWITQEIIQKYSPRILRKNRKDESDNRHSIVHNKSLLPQEIDIPKETAMKTSTITRPKIPKVSVGIDATPSGRGQSVLRQEPIEIMKSFDYSYIDNEAKPSLRRSITLDDVSPMESPEYHNEPTLIKIEHKHSNSDPVQDVIYSQIKKLKTFNPEGDDINVTSREDNNAASPLSPEESLDMIRRRKFPKVLPDYPDRLINNRRSMPVCALINSQDPYQLSNFSRVPPAPPPRSATLTKQSSEPQDIFNAESSCRENEQESAIKCSTLFVGPILPKNKPATKTTDDVESKKPVAKISDDLGKEMKKNKPVISPKVVIKPTLSKKPSEEKINKTIPRVVVPDNQPYQQSLSSKDARFDVKSDQKDTNKDETKPDQKEYKEVIEKADVQIDATDKPVNKNVKKSQIPMLIRTPSMNKESFSTESTPTSEESDTGTVVKKI
ncbi:unnamed protein product [Phyllotreta striolata]|uniref:Carboxylesterase type B domain-containing protein n=1 Tax=Phyllotreta striolata TaxID=444603 RepID=A0A9N9TH03_PHYSR|nr:unnamed protein product [Phyllotreta striolata]